MLPSGKPVDMICHQDVRVYRQTVSLGCISQAAQEPQTVAVAAENVLAIVAPQRDVRREFLCK